MRFSYWIPNTFSWSETLEQARHAEAIGYDGVWYADHFMPNAADPVEGPAQEMFAILAGWPPPSPGCASARWWPATPTATPPSWPRSPPRSTR